MFWPDGSGMIIQIGGDNTTNDRNRYTFSDEHENLKYGKDMSENIR